MGGNGWKTIPLVEFTSLQRGHDLPKQNRRPGSVPILGSFGITGWHDESKVSGPGVTVGRSGASFGVVSYSECDYWPLNTALFVKDFHNNDELFAYYLLKTLDFKRYNSGSAVQSLNRNHIHPMLIEAPPLPEQKTIAGILGALDDKIELNRRMNETLESMARAIFKSWFVDFDPVRAKMDGQHPAGMNPETGALFPDSFEEQDGEMIPKGWTVEAVGEVVQSLGGATPSTKKPEFWEGGTHHWATPKDLSGLPSPILLKTGRRITDAGVDKISSGLLPTGTLLLSSRAPVGYLAIAQMPVAVNQGFIAMVCNERASNYFMLNWCGQNMAEIESRASGTTFQEISKKNFRPIPMILPPVELVTAYTDRVSPLFEQMITNLRASQTLANLRDTLLPKLLSGELRVPEAEKQVEEIL